MKQPRSVFFSLVILAAGIFAGAASAMLGVCGPFTDITDAAFCPNVLEIFFLGITTGTTPTTYDPASSVTRLQMAIFLSRQADRVLQRASSRAALDQYWLPQTQWALHLTTVPAQPAHLRSDGEDVWVASSNGTIARIRGSDGRVLETWTGAANPGGVLVAAGRIFVAGGMNPGVLYRIDPRQAAGAVTTVATTQGSFPIGITYDGTRIWTADNTSVSIITPGASLPWTATTVTAGFTAPIGALFDGSNVWVTDDLQGALKKLDSSGAVLMTVSLGASVGFPAFDGSNIWVPNDSADSVTVVRASNGARLATLTGNGLDVPVGSAFDGQRILVTNENGSSVSLWKAADFSPLGSSSTGAGTLPFDVCSDGRSFWITLAVANKVARF